MQTNNESIIVLVELAGFKAISKQLSLDCDHIGFNIETAQHALRRSLERLVHISSATAPFEINPWGSDTFILRFMSITEAVSVATVILQRARIELMNGTSLLKPIIGITSGSYTMQNGQPLGPYPISLHEVCKHQLPFSLLVANSLPHKTIPENSFVLDKKIEPLKTQSGVAYRRYFLQSTSATHALPLLKLCGLTDNLSLLEGLITHDMSESISLLNRLQSESQKSIHIVGGGIPTTSEMFDNYVRSQIKLLLLKARNKNFGFRRILICYANETARSYYWLLFNALALENFRRIYDVRVKGQSRTNLKPLGFQVIDDLHLWIALRSYNVKHSMPVTQYALCFESRFASTGFNEIFKEYWRGAEELTSNGLRKKADQLRGLSKEDKIELRKHLEKLFESTV